jgi:hypothetical protein
MRAYKRDEDSLFPAYYNFPKIESLLSNQFHQKIN